MGGKQLGFSDYELTTAKKQTKREKFLSEMEVVVPWQALIELIEPHYPKASKKGGRPPYPLATMLLTWTPKTEPVLMRASLPARIGQEKPHESQTPQPRADHPQAAHC